MTCNFTVINKDDNKFYDIYDITYDKTGYAHFLVYKDGEWIRMSAKHFKPYDREARYKEMIAELKNTPLQIF